MQETRQPEFVSSAYFLRFKFDAGRYALVGREQLEGQDVLRVEYYPTKLFCRRRRTAARGAGAGPGWRRDQPNDKPNQTTPSTG